MTEHFQRRNQALQDAFHELERLYLGATCASEPRDDGFDEQLERTRKRRKKQRRQQEKREKRAKKRVAKAASASSS